MNERWHIKSNNSVSQCKANPGECLYGNEDKHYPSFDKALSALHHKLTHTSVTFRAKRQARKTTKRYREVRASIEYILQHMKEYGGYLARENFSETHQAIMTYMMQKANQRLTDEAFYYLAVGEQEPPAYTVEETETRFQLDPDMWKNINDPYWVKNNYELQKLHERLLNRIEKAATIVPPKQVIYEQSVGGKSTMGDLSTLTDKEIKGHYGDEYSHHLALAIFDRNPKRYRLWEAASSLDWDGDDTGLPEAVHFFAEDTKHNTFIDVYGSFASPKELMGDWEDFKNDPTLRFIRYGNRNSILELFQDSADFHENYNYDANYVIDRLGLVK